MIGRLRKGEWIAVGGLVGLIITLFLSWFTVGKDSCDGSEVACRAFDRLVPLLKVDSGWGPLGRPWSDLLIISGLLVIWAVVMTLRAGPGKPTYGAVVSNVIAGFVTFFVTIAVAIRVLFVRPDFPLPGGQGEVNLGIGVGGWIALASLLAILVGLWIALADDRTDAAESAYDLPTPRPAPHPEG